MDHPSTNFAAGILCIWLSVWAIRKKSEVDYSLDRTSRVARWVAVAFGFALVYVPGPRLGWLRVTGYLIGLAFLCWPNFSYLLTHGRPPSDVPPNEL